MRYNSVLGSYRRLREFRNEADKLGTCPNSAIHAGDRNRRGVNPSKGGRCLINCIRDAKLRLHNVAVAVLSKRIHGKGFVAAAMERLLHQTLRKRADIEVRSDSDVNQPFYVDVTIVHNKNLMGVGRRASSSKSLTRSPAAQILKGSLSLGIISFGRVLALSLKLMPMPVRRRFLKGANLLLLFIL